jgi:hypothetical protein
MDQTRMLPSEEGRFDSKGLSTCKNAKRESHDHQEIGVVVLVDDDGMSTYAVLKGVKCEEFIGS